MAQNLSDGDRILTSPFQGWYEHPVGTKLLSLCGPHHSLMVCLSMSPSRSGTVWFVLLSECDYLTLPFILKGVLIWTIDYFVAVTLLIAAVLLAQ